MNYVSGVAYPSGVWNSRLKRPGDFSGDRSRTLDEHTLLAAHSGHYTLEKGLGTRPTWAQRDESPAQR